MKMNTIKFAKLINFITIKTGILQSNEIAHIADLIDAGVVETIPTLSSKHTIRCTLQKISTEAGFGSDYDYRAYVTLIENHSRFKTGEQVVTSKLVKVDFEAGLIETQNTIYKFK